MARWRAYESALESAVPLVAAATAWIVAYKLMSAPTPSRPLTDPELLSMLGAACALNGWAMARQLFIFGKRNPRTHVVVAMVTVAIVLASIGPLVRIGFTGNCGNDLAGEVTEMADPLRPHRSAIACRVMATAGNDVLTGAIVHPGWSGRLGVGAWLAMLALAALGALGLRDKRLRATQAPEKLRRALRLAPAQGSANVVDSVSDDWTVQACARATLWGETCGQLYNGDRKFEPGEWCVRCHQPFQSDTRELEFRVVTLFTDDIDVLNGLERIDTVAWPRGERMPSEHRASMQGRWIELGKVRLPSVTTVAQALALVHEWIDSGPPSADADLEEPRMLALRRASRICAWLWCGRVSHKLNYARPTQDAVFAFGPQRLQDLVGNAAQELTLQLDIGLLPLELRTAFHKSFLDTSLADQVQNSKTDLWVPVSPPPSAVPAPGVWVDRVEGDALRTWLATERRRTHAERGTTVPLAYAPHGMEAAIRDSTLDYVRMPLDRDSNEPTMHPHVGASIAEWDWLEWEQIELLRREALVLVDAGGLG